MQGMSSEETPEIEAFYHGKLVRWLSTKVLTDDYNQPDAVRIEILRKEMERIFGEEHPNISKLLERYLKEQKLTHGLYEARIKLIEAYEDICYALGYYLDWDINEVKLHGLWILSTYFFKCFNTFPYRYIMAMKGSGKTRLLKLTEALCWNGKLTTGMSDSALFRGASEHTYIFDEHETIARKEKQSQREILNSGYKKGAKIIKVQEKYENKEKKYVNVEYDVFSPKMMANISGMEEVLEDRCIASIMERSNNPSKTKLIEDFDTNPFFSNIKANLLKFSALWCSELSGNKCWDCWNSYVFSKYTYTTTPHTYTTLNYTKLHLKDISDRDLQIFNMIDRINLDGRNLELFFPLFIVASILTDDILVDILKVAEEKVKSKRETDLYQSKDVAVIDYISRMNIGIDFIALKELVYGFKEFFQNTEEDLSWISSHWLGKALDRLKLISAKRRLNKGVEVVLNIAKAKEKLKMFKKEEKE